jgi:hypothetical protein
MAPSAWSTQNQCLKKWPLATGKCQKMI